MLAESACEDHKSQGRLLANQPLNLTYRHEIQQIETADGDPDREFFIYWNLNTEKLGWRCSFIVKSKR